jgi:hypothetical protein
MPNLKENTMLSERLKDRLIALMEAGRLESATERLPMLLEHGRFALEELKEVIQLEAENTNLRKYAKHHSACDFFYPHNIDMHSKCECGLKEVLNA